jgi:hypothetical protein
MSLFICDVEADGPVAPLYSMISIGLIKVNADGTFESFYGELKPLAEANWIPEALAVSGFSREKVMTFPDAETVIHRMADWIQNVNTDGRPILWSDNNQFDGGYVNYYTHRFLGSNPFGHSSRNIGDLYKGLVKDTRKNFKHLRKTKHTHHPVDDAKGNMEALLAMKNSMGLQIGMK